MWPIHVLFVLLTGVEITTSMNCFDCQLADPSVDLTELDLDALQSLLQASSCNLGGYSIGADSTVQVSCGEAREAIPGVAIWGKQPASNVHISPGAAQSGDAQVTYSMETMTSFHNYFSQGGSHVSSSGQCIWTRNHQDCRDADDEDRNTICACHTPDYTIYGCSGSSTMDYSLWMVYILVALVFNLIV